MKILRSMRKRALAALRKRALAALRKRALVIMLRAAPPQVQAAYWLAKAIKAKAIKENK